MARKSSFFIGVLSGPDELPLPSGLVGLVACRPVEVSDYEKCRILYSCPFKDFDGLLVPLLSCVRSHMEYEEFFLGYPEQPANTDIITAQEFILPRPIRDYDYIGRAVSVERTLCLYNCRRERH